MSDLLNKKCIPCEGGVDPLTLEKSQELLKEIKGWSLEDNKKIKKVFQFKDFKYAMGFVNEVADIAEYEGHHPDILIFGWNKVEINLSTHAIGGLSENDFIMAAKIDAIEIE